MANKNISQLTAATTVNNADLFVLEQNGVAKKLTGSLLLATIEAHGGIASTSYTAPVAPSLQGTLTLTYADGTSDDIPIYNGAKGDTGAAGATGADGYSPTASVAKVGHRATITITDKNGTTSAYVQDGNDGQDGNPGYCYIKWAGVEPASDADMGDIPDEWLGIYAGSSSTAPTHYTDYVWYKVKGEDGEAGATGDRGTYIWMSRYEPYEDSGYYWIAKTDLIQPGNLTAAVLQRGDLVIYADGYYYATGISTETSYQLSYGHWFNSASVPSGGATNCRLAKASASDYDLKWDSPSVYIATRSTTTLSIGGAATEGKTVILEELNTLVVGKKDYSYTPLIAFTVEGDFSDPDVPLISKRVAAFAKTMIDGSTYWVTATWQAGLLQETWTSGIISGGGGGTPYDSNPSMDGTAAAGSSSAYARGDHVHPSDTSRQAKITASGILKGDGNGGVTAATAGTDYLVTAPVTSVNSKTGAVSLSASDVGAIASPSSPTSGQFLMWNGSAWVASNLPVYNGGVS